MYFMYFDCMFAQVLFYTSLKLQTRQGMTLFYVEVI